MRGMMHGQLPRRMPGPMPGPMRGPYAALSRGLLAVQLLAPFAGTVVVSPGVVSAVRLRPSGRRQLLDAGMPLDFARPLSYPARIREDPW